MADIENTNSYFNTPFASTGSRAEIPTDKQDDGSVSWSEGFGNSYDLPLSNGGLYIKRTEFNEIMHRVTSLVLENSFKIKSGGGGVTVNLTNYYTKSQVDELIANRDLSNYFTKNDINSRLLLKVDVATLQKDYLTATAINAMVDLKADKTALENFYTKSQVDNIHNTLVSDNYSKSEVNALLANKMDISVVTANYTTSIDLKQLLLAKADKTALDTQSTKHNEDITNLTTAMNKVSDELATTIKDLTNTATKINAIVPTTASATNQLTDKEYVDNAVKTASARAISADADGTGFASLEALKTGKWYSLGEETTPTTNDYAVVKSDALHNGNDVRYNYDGAVWVFFQEFTSGSSVTFTTSQQLAIDSGITAAKVTEIQANATAITEEATARIKGDADIMADIEKRVKSFENKIGDMTTLNTDVTTTLVECINDFHTEMHNERLATDGSNAMTGQLDIKLAGSGDLLLMKAGDKGVNFHLDASTGYMSIVPESAKSTGFEVSHNTLRPRTSAIEYSLGDNSNYFTNTYTKNINNIAVSDFLTNADIDKTEYNQLKTTVAAHTTDITNRVEKTGDTMTGELKISLAGSGSVFHMEAGGKGVTFNMDAETGYVHIVPVSAPLTGFEISAFSLEPRTTAIPYRLGNSGNKWDTIWVNKINNTEVSTLAKTSDLDALKHFATNAKSGLITFTQEEYDALSVEEQNNGKLYIIVG